MAMWPPTCGGQQQQHEHEPGESSASSARRATGTASVAPWPSSGTTQPLSEGMRVLVAPDDAMALCRMHMRPPYSFHLAKMGKLAGKIGCVRKVYASGPVAVSHYEMRNATQHGDGLDKEVVRTDWVWHPAALRPATSTASGGAALLRDNNQVAVHLAVGDLCVVNEHEHTLNRLHNDQVPQQVLAKLCGRLVYVEEVGPAGRLATKVRVRQQRSDSPPGAGDNFTVLSDCLVPVYMFAMRDGVEHTLVAHEQPAPVPVGGGDWWHSAERLIKSPVSASSVPDCDTLSLVARACRDGGPHSDTVLMRFAVLYANHINASLPAEFGAGYSAIMLAAQFNQTNVINILWRMGAADIAMQSPVDGRSAFHLAADNGCLPALHVLMSAAVELDASGELLRRCLTARAFGADDSTPVHCCVDSMHQLRFKPLSDSNADVPASNGGGGGGGASSPAESLVFYKVPAATVDWSTVCVDAANDTNPPLCLKRMLDTGLCDLAIRDSRGCTALHLSVCVLCTDAVGFDPSAAAGAPAHADAQCMLDALLAAAPPHVALVKEAESGGTPLHAAVRGNCAPAVRLLCHYRAELVCVPNETEMTPMHVAAYIAFGDALITMLDAAAPVGQLLPRSVRALCRAGRTPLHYSVTRLVGAQQLQQRSTAERFRCVECLLDKGADPTITDGMGRTALHLATKELNAHRQSHHTLLNDDWNTRLAAHNLTCAYLQSQCDRCPWLGIALLLATRGGGSQILDNNEKRPLDYLDAPLRDKLAPLFVRYDSDSRLSAGGALAAGAAASMAPAVASLLQDVHSLRLDANTADTMCLKCHGAPAVVIARPCEHLLLCAACNSTHGRSIGICYVCHGGVTGFAHRAPAADVDKRAGEAIECAICMDSAISVAFKCGHVACEHCAERIDTCHVCRRVIEDKHRIYLGSAI